MPRPAVMSHFRNGNVGLCICRQIISDTWSHVFAINNIVDNCLVSNKTRERGYAIPLYLQEEDLLEDVTKSTPNIDVNLAKEISRALSLQWDPDKRDVDSLNPANLLGLVYSELHSPRYRERYFEPLCSEFPRLFVPDSTELFRTLATLGQELFHVHLMDSPQLDRFLTTTVGSDEFRVEKVSYSDETVWIDKAKTRGFQGVPEEVWNFHIGSYQICEKWIKDRGPKKGKKGRVLTDEDIDHYQKIVVALSETIRIMAEIDEVIEAHGGWPDAFVTS